MKIKQFEISLTPKERGVHLVTNEILKQIDIPINKGLMHIFIKHTSASLALNENADPSVRFDSENFLNYLIPENYPNFTHTLEGADDMPAHIKNILIGSSITIPITNNRPNLGTWQGIYLLEHRNYGGSRNLVITIIGE
jgi:secondary thiamine-phosphate synthase enzyme